MLPSLETPEGETLVGVREGKDRGCAKLKPTSNFLGELLRQSLKGEGGGRFAGLARTRVDKDFSGDEGATC